MIESYSLLKLYQKQTLILGLIDSNCFINASRLAGEIIRGIELFRTLRSVKEMAIRSVSDVAGAERMDFVFFISLILSIGRAVGTKN